MVTPPHPLSPPTSISQICQLIRIARVLSHMTACNENLTAKGPGMFGAIFGPTTFLNFQIFFLSLLMLNET